MMEMETDVAVDEKGELIDGDRIMAVISNYLKEKGKLNKILLWQQ